MKIIPFFSIFVLCLFIAACQAPSDTKDEKEQPQKKPATLVEVVVASKGSLNREIQTTATLMANESANLSAEVGGIIKKIY